MKTQSNPSDRAATTELAEDSASEIERSEQNSASSATDRVNDAPAQAPDALEPLETKVANLKDELEEKAAHCGEEIEPGRDTTLVSVHAKVNDLKSDLQSLADKQRDDLNDEPN